MLRHPLFWIPYTNVFCSWSKLKRNVTGFHCLSVDSAINFCSDLRNENNGIFVLGWVFQTMFNFLTSHFDGIFYIIQKVFVVLLSLNLEGYFTCDHFFFNECAFGHFGTINARYISRY